MSYENSKKYQINILLNSELLVIYDEILFLMKKGKT